MIRFLFFFFLPAVIFSTDFDSILIGSSPFCLFEAIYRANSGEKVLILEESSSLGGAWQSIDICGVSKVDLGCHTIGTDLKLKAFLETYAGCTFVSMDNPKTAYQTGKGGYYFSRGCQELIERLANLAQIAGVQIQTCQKAQTASIDPISQIATVSTPTHVYYAKRLVLTPMSSVVFLQSGSPQTFSSSKYYHLYLLVQDPSPPQFTYKSGGIQGISRMMNLTPFTDLSETGRQLIAIQTHSEKSLETPQKYIDALKQKKWLSESADLLQSEPYIYEAGRFNQKVISDLKVEKIVEVLETGTFLSLKKYMGRWQKALHPYGEIFPFAN